MPSHCHDIRTFAPLGLSNGQPPFLALTKVRSRFGSSLTLFLSAILGSADGKPLGTAIGLADLARQPRYEAPTESYSLHLDCNSRAPFTVFSWLFYWDQPFQERSLVIGQFHCSRSLVEFDLFYPFLS